MNRRSLLAVAAGAHTLPGLVSAQDADFESGGLGLPLSAWEDGFGASEPGQNYMSFPTEAGNFWVGVNRDSQVVDYIERNWADMPAATLAEADKEVRGLLPADAELTERYVANYAEILHGAQIDRYVSRSLASQILPPLNGGSEDDATIAVIYELVPAPEAFDYVVGRYFITIGDIA
jgi:hypothetical protein